MNINVGFEGIDAGLKLANPHMSQRDVQAVAAMIRAASAAGMSTGYTIIVGSYRTYFNVSSGGTSVT